MRYVAVYRFHFPIAVTILFRLPVKIVPRCPILLYSSRLFTGCYHVYTVRDPRVAIYHACCGCTLPFARLPPHGPLHTFTTVFTRFTLPCCRYYVVGCLYVTTTFLHTDDFTTLFPLVIHIYFDDLRRYTRSGRSYVHVPLRCIYIYVYAFADSRSSITAFGYLFRTRTAFPRTRTHVPVLPSYHIATPDLRRLPHVLATFVVPTDSLLRLIYTHYRSRC